MKIEVRIYQIHIKGTFKALAYASLLRGPLHPTQCSNANVVPTESCREFQPLEASWRYGNICSLATGLACAGLLGLCPPHSESLWVREGGLRSGALDLSDAAAAAPIPLPGPNLPSSLSLSPPHSIHPLTSWYTYFCWKASGGHQSTELAVSYLWQ